MRRFLVAFLTYEVEGDETSRAAIRALATPSFASALLDRPALRPAASAPVRIATLDLTRLPSSPDLLLATGTARRPSGPEPLAFLFARRRGRWLAVAPAE